MIENDARSAARLVMLGTDAALHPSKSLEYRRLLGTYHQDLAFRELAMAIAEGLGLSILHSSAEGLIVAPTNSDSRFAMTLGQFKSRLPAKWHPEFTQGVIILLNVGIVAAFFPTPGHIDDPERGSNTVSVPEIIQSVRAACTALAQAHGQGRDGTEAFPEEIKPAFERLLALPDTHPDGVRRSATTLDGLIRSLIEMLREERLVAPLDEQATPVSYFATERLRQMLRRRAGTLLECCHDLLSHAEAAGGGDPDAVQGA